MDLAAKEELDGADLDVENDIDPIESDLDNGLETPEKPKNSGSQEYNASHIASQLEGMVEHWFKIAQEMPPEKKENFLKLGDRLSEISEVLKSEFINNG